MQRPSSTAPDTRYLDWVSTQPMRQRAASEGAEFFVMDACYQIAGNFVKQIFGNRESFPKRRMRQDLRLMRFGFPIGGGVNSWT